MPKYKALKPLVADQVLEGDGVTIAYADAGSRSGDAVLLLHGMMVGSKSWNTMSVVDDLLENGFRVIAPDVRGHGRSSKPRDITMYGKKQVG